MFHPLYSFKKMCIFFSLAINSLSGLQLINLLVTPKFMPAFLDLAPSLHIYIFKHLLVIPVWLYHKCFNQNMF